MTDQDRLIVQALHAVKEDAVYAWMQALGGDFSTLPTLHKSWRALEAALIAADQPEAPKVG